MQQEHSIKSENSLISPEKLEQIERMASAYAHAEYDELRQKGLTGSWRRMYDLYLIHLISAHMQSEHYQVGYRDGYAAGAKRMREKAAQLIDPDPWVVILEKPFQKKAAAIRNLKVE